MQLCFHTALGTAKTQAVFLGSYTELQGQCSWAHYQKIKVSQILYPSKDLPATRIIFVSLIYASIPKVYLV